MIIDGKRTLGKWKDALSKLGKNKFVILLLIAGVVLMLLPSQKKEEEVGDSTENISQFSVSKAEQQLSELLTALDGAGNVKVMLSIKDEGRRIIAEDTETSESGGDTVSNDKTEKAVIVSSSGSKEDVVTLGYIYPEYLGALVAAEGADSARIRLEILEAVSAVTGLSADNIKVIKMK